MITEMVERKELLPYIYDDGGRSQYFRRKDVGDCVCRSLAIASGRDYKEIYDALWMAMGESPRNGVNVRSEKFKRFVAGLGFEWTSLCSVGSRKSTHLFAGEFPTVGRYVCSVSGHMVAVVDGVVRDTWDSRYNSFGEARRVYGYWRVKE